MDFKKLLTKSYFLLIVTIVIFLFIDWRISTGIVLAYPFSYFQSKLITLRFTKPAEGGRALLVAFGFFIDLLILAVPMIITGFFNEYFSFIGVFIGLIFEKYYLFFRVLVIKEDPIKWH